jgi:hypothetical protein
MTLVGTEYALTTLRMTVEARRIARFKFKVIHRHRIGTLTFRRVSELVFIGGAPKAVLAWMDMAGIRIPIYCELKPTKLHQCKLREFLRGPRRTYYYDGITADPRYRDQPEASETQES